jgi:hypothetical protein
MEEKIMVFPARGRRLDKLMEVTCDPREYPIEMQYDFFEDILSTELKLEFTRGWFNENFMFLFSIDKYEVDRALNFISWYEQEKEPEYRLPFYGEGKSYYTIINFTNFAGTIINFFLLEKGLKNLISTFAPSELDRCIVLSKNNDNETIAHLFVLKDKVKEYYP